MAQSGIASKRLQVRTKPFLKEVSHRLLESLPISTKLVAGFLAISIIAMLIGVTGLYFIERINSTLNNITDVAAPTVETSDDLIANILEAAKLGGEIIAVKEPSSIGPLKAEFDFLSMKFDRSFVELQSIVADDELLDELETAKREKEQFTFHADSMLEAYLQELQKEAEGRELLTEFDAAGAVLINALDEFADENEREMAKAEEQGDQLEEDGASGAIVNRVLGQLFDQDYPVVESALKLQRLIIEMQDTAGEYLAVGDALGLGEVEREFRALLNEVQPHLNVLSALAETEEDKEDALLLEEMLGKWVDIAYGPGKLFATHQSMLQAEANADGFAVSMSVNADNTTLVLDRIAETADAISRGADEAAAEAVTQAQSAIIILLLLALIGASGLLWLIVSMVVRPIRNLTGTMVSFGDNYGQSYAADMPAGDEVTQLWFAFDRLRSQVYQRTEELQMRSVELDKANRNLEQELATRQTLERQLVHAQKLEGLGTLAGGIAHDFNNMLYVILGCTKITLDELPSDHSIVPLIRKIDQAAERSSSIVRQILFFSRQHTPDRHPVDVADVMRESVTLLRAGLPSSIVLDLDIDDECGIILADETQIQQVVVNLVTNAFQAHSERRGKINLGVKPVLVEKELADQHIALNPGPYICISVSDNGDGIPGDVLMKVFDPFFTTKPVGEGTGLGLAVVHGIVTAHDGAIIVSTEVGSGTTFDVYFPSNESENELGHSNQLVDNYAAL